MELKLKKIFDELKVNNRTIDIIRATGISRASISKICSSEYNRNITPEECAALNREYGISIDVLRDAFLEKQAYKDAIRFNNALGYCSSLKSF